MCLFYHRIFRTLLITIQGPSLFLTFSSGWLHCFVPLLWWSTPRAFGGWGVNFYRGFLGFRLVIMWKLYVKMMFKRGIRELKDITSIKVILKCFLDLSKVPICCNYGFWLVSLSREPLELTYGGKTFEWKLQVCHNTFLTSIETKASCLCI